MKKSLHLKKSSPGQQAKSHGCGSASRCFNKKAKRRTVLVRFREIGYHGIWCFKRFHQIQSLQQGDLGLNLGPFWCWTGGPHCVLGKTLLRPMPKRKHRKHPSMVQMVSQNRRSDHLRLPSGPDADNVGGNPKADEEEIMATEIYKDFEAKIKELLCQKAVGNPFGRVGFDGQSLELDGSINVYQWCKCLWKPSMCFEPIVEDCSTNTSHPNEKNNVFRCQSTHWWYRCATAGFKQLFSGTKPGLKDGCVGVIRA